MAIGIRCYGKVQGVFYRASTKNQAEDLQVCGWVLNEPEGTVLIHAEGEEKALKALLKWAKKGPEFARVDKIESWEKPDEAFDSFEIRR